MPSAPHDCGRVTKFAKASQPRRRFRREYSAIREGSPDSWRAVRYQRGVEQWESCSCFCSPAPWFRPLLDVLRCADSHRPRERRRGPERTEEYRAGQSPK
jgi:hypothetical protein